MSATQLRVERFDGRFTSAVDASCVSFQLVSIQSVCIANTTRANECPQSTLSTALYNRRNRNIHCVFGIGFLFFVLEFFGWKHYYLLHVSLFSYKLEEVELLILLLFKKYLQRQRREKEKKINSFPSKFTFIAARVRLTIIERENSRILHSLY